MDLSILIPARNEEFLGKTIENILENIEGSTEVIVVLDGYTDDTLPKDPRVIVVKLPKAIGQRAATNLACKLSEAKYVMKVDAHCSFDKGFDVKMVSEMKDDYTMIPTMRNLHAFDWVCPDGHRRYQGPEGVCVECGKETTKDIVWIGKNSPQSTAYRFDKNLHFQYWNEYKAKQIGDIVETMTIQGSCFMLTREKYWELDICDEKFGSWGQQGVEVAVKTWLSGGRVVVNKKTWYAHMFRTQPGFGFPWPASGSSQEKARELSKDIFFNNKWPKAIHDFKWLIDKFSPVPGWEKITKGIVYYTDNELNPDIMNMCQKQLMKLESDKLPIVSVSLKPIDFGVNYVLPLKRGLLTMSKQILKGLEESTSDVIFFCEHDVLYHPSHFDFTPINRNIYYYNTNSWMFRASDGHSLYYEHKSLSGMCGYRETLLEHFRERVRRIEELEKEANGTGIVKALAPKSKGAMIPLREAIHRLGFEPGTHTRPDRIDMLWNETYQSKEPNIDIKHDHNWTKNRWSVDEFRDKTVANTWKEADELPFWGKITI